MFTHTVSREDAARVSDQRAAKIVVLEASRRTGHPNDMLELVIAMRTFGLSSDVCNNSFDSRCDRPGVREPLRRSSVKRRCSGRQHIVRIALSATPISDGHRGSNGSSGGKTGSRRWHAAYLLARDRGGKAQPALACLGRIEADEDILEGH
jgi:hypothetical protein